MVGFGLVNRRLALAVIIVGASASLSACAATAAADSGRVDRVRDGLPRMELSGFETGVFADGQVSQAEYDEAYSLWKSCSEGRGVTVSVERDEWGLYREVTTLPKELATEERMYQDSIISQECERGTYVLVEAVYRDQVLNPESRDWNDGIVSCLIDRGIVGADFTRDDLLSGQSTLPRTDDVTECHLNPFGVTAGS